MYEYVAKWLEAELPLGAFEGTQTPVPPALGVRRESGNAMLALGDWDEHWAAMDSAMYQMLRVHSTHVYCILIIL